MGQRVIYSCKSVSFAGLGTLTGTANNVVHGVQSVGCATNFRLDQIFELGQLEIYHNRENIPDVEITMQKVLDGYCPAYLLATSGSSAATLAGRSNTKSIFAMSIFDDSIDQASGSELNTVVCSGVYPSQVSYSFQVEGPFTEDLTLVGNHKLWKNNTGFTYSFPGFFGSGISMPDSPYAGSASGNVNFRENLLFNYSSGFQATDANGLPIFASGCTLPRDIDGIDSSGRNQADTDGFLKARLQSIQVSTNLGRQELFQLGKRLPYHRFTQFPTEVTCAIETFAKSGDMVSATEDGVYSGGTNLRNESIRLVTSEGLRLDLGTKNKLASVNEAGGDTGGGNETITYNYSNFNVLTVRHANDCTSSIRSAVFPT